MCSQADLWGLWDVESSIFHKACSPHSSREHRPLKSKAPLVWHRPRGAVTGVHCQRQSTKKVVKGKLQEMVPRLFQPQRSCPCCLQYSASMASRYLASMILGSRLYLRQSTGRGSVLVYVFLSVPKLLVESGGDTQSAEGDTQWGTEKPTNPARKHSPPSWRSLLLSAGKRTPYQEESQFLELCHHRVLSITKIQRWIFVIFDSKQDHPDLVFGFSTWRPWFPYFSFF